MDERIAEAVEKIKALVKKGNVERVVLTKDGEVLVNLPVTAGVLGGVIGLHAAPWLVIGSALAAAGFGCKVELVKPDGEVFEADVEDL